MRWTEVPAAAWRTPQELVQEGFGRSRVVMLNEAHHGHARCVRTRRLGRQLLPGAHAMGVRHLAMEALRPGWPSWHRSWTATEELLGYWSRRVVRWPAGRGWTP